MKLGLLTIAIIFGASLPAQAASDTWDLDPMHSAASFSIRHLMISDVKGEFSKIGGSIQYDGHNVNTAHVNAVITADSINTANADRDKHLKSSDFFDTTTYPEIKFQSTKIVKQPDGKYTMIGDLTMHGVTKPVTLTITEVSPAVHGMHGETRVGATAVGMINRKDFGIIWNKTLDNGGVALGEEVPITLNIEMVQKPATALK